MSLKSKFADILYVRPCRAYSNIIVKDKPADQIYRFMCSLQFFRVHGFWPNFTKPLRLTEKIWSRMLHDRNPQWTIFNDKLRVRDYIKDKIGEEILVPLLWVGEDPDDIPFERLPSQFVIKANHGCSFNIIVRDKTTLNIAETKSIISKWLSTNYGKDFFLGIEWGYKHIVPKIMIETFIGENGKVPTDYKFYCFSGRIEFLTLHFDRFEGHKTRSFDRNFEPHAFTYHFRQWSGECKKPPMFEQMVDTAETLASGFEFLRVDLYALDNKIYFGELTPYPGGISTKFLPVSLDYELGKKWI